MGYLEGMEKPYQSEYWCDNTSRKNSDGLDSRIYNLNLMSFCGLLASQKPIKVLQYLLRWLRVLGDFLHAINELYLVWFLSGIVSLLVLTDVSDLWLKGFLTAVVDLCFESFQGSLPFFFVFVLNRLVSFLCFWAVMSYSVSFWEYVVLDL